MSQGKARGWSEEEFGGALLGNTARARRLVQMAASAAERPAGKIVEVFDESAPREAAYRFVESVQVDYLPVGHAAHVAAFVRAGSEKVVFIPIDGSSLSLPAANEASDFGPIGNKWATTSGCHAMNAIAVSEDGAPIGPVGQAYWVRPKRQRRSRKDSSGEGKKRPKRYRAIEEKESRYWGMVVDQVLAAAKEANYQGRLWFQLDAGADFYEMLSVIPTLDAWATIRVAHGHRNTWEQGVVLRDAVARASIQGTYELKVPASPNRTARAATIEVRACPEVLALRWRAEQSPVPCPLYVIQAREVSSCPAGEEPIEWLLLTTRPVNSMSTALEVIQGYTKRWRIEEVHKAWKSVTKVEESALENVPGFYAWATVLFSVALRIERLKYLARTTPDAPALQALLPEEIEAIHILKETPPRTRSAQLTIAIAVRYVAELGGYTSPKSSGGPPGTITIGRGLKRVTALAALLPRIRGET